MMVSRINGAIKRTTGEVKDSPEVLKPNIKIASKRRNKTNVTLMV
jgi:hypothetical protein